MKQRYVYDLETLKTLFCGVFKSRKDGSKREFVIHQSKNQLYEMILFLENEVEGLIGFNNTGFDYPVLHYILTKKWDLLAMEAEEVIAAIYARAQEIIERQNGNDKIIIWDRDVKIPQLDLFKIHHYDNRAKMCGLKWIQYSMDWHNLEDMPIHHSADVSEEEIPMILSYCHNDVESTDAFFDITLGKTEHPLYKGINRVELRKNIQKVYGFNCDNFNDVKIGDNITKDTYLKLSGITSRELKEKRTVKEPIPMKDCIASYVKFETLHLQKFLEFFQSKTIVNTKGDSEHLVEFGGREYTFGTGGLHSVDKPCIVIPQPGEFLEDRDVN